MQFNLIQSTNQLNLIQLNIVQSIEFNPIKLSIQLNSIILNCIQFWIKLIQVTLIYFNLIWVTFDWGWLTMTSWLIQDTCQCGDRHQTSMMQTTTSRYIDDCAAVTLSPSRPLQERVELFPSRLTDSATWSPDNWGTAYSTQLSNVPKGMLT